MDLIFLILCSIFSLPKVNQMLVYTIKISNTGAIYPPFKALNFMNCLGTYPVGVRQYEVPRDLLLISVQRISGSVQW